MKKRSSKLTPVTREDILQIFSNINEELKQRRQKITITVVGGVSIILLGIRDRATLDIDIANVGDAIAFRTIAENLGISTDIITVSSTVDFNHAQKKELFRGDFLAVNSIMHADIIRMKLERFRKQDPEDIEAIIMAGNISCDEFKAIVADMRPYFVGNPQELALSAQIIIERVYKLFS